MSRRSKSNSTASTFFAVLSHPLGPLSLFLLLCAAVFVCGTIIGYFRGIEDNRTTRRMNDQISIGYHRTLAIEDGCIRFYNNNNNNNRFPSSLDELIAFDESICEIDGFGTPFVYKCPGEINLGYFDVISCGPNEKFDNGYKDDQGNWFRGYAISPITWNGFAEIRRAFLPAGEL